MTDNHRMPPRPQEVMGLDGITWQAIGGAMMMPEQDVKPLVHDFQSRHPMHGDAASELHPCGSITIQIFKDHGWELPKVRLSDITTGGEP